MEEPFGLQSMGSLGVGHDWATSLSLFTFMHWRRKWQPTLVFFPRESQGQRSLVGCCLWGRTESDTTEQLSSSSSSRGKEYFIMTAMVLWLSLYLLKYLVLIDSLPDKMPSFMKAVLSLFGLWSSCVSVLVLVHGGCSIQMRKAAWMCS